MVFDIFRQFAIILRKFRFYFPRLVTLNFSRKKNKAAIGGGGGFAFFLLFRTIFEKSTSSRAR